MKAAPVRENVKTMSARHPRSRSIACSILSFIVSAAFSTYWYTVCHSKIFAVFALLASLLIGLLVFLWSSGIIEQLNEKKYGVILAISCIVFTFVFPPTTVPDETHHYLSSYWLADCLQGQASFADSSSFPMRDSDWQMLSGSSNSVSYDSYKVVFDNFELFDSSDEVYEASYSFSLGSENVVTKLGSVLAIVLGKAIGLGAYPVFYLGRLFNSAYFILLTLAAYKLIPFAKNIIVCISLLPMTLHLAASFSYDSGIIGLALLLTALLCRSIVNDGPISAKELIAIGVCVVFLAPCKLIYTPIGLLFFLIPKERFGGLKNKLIIGFTFIALALISIGIFRLPGVVSLASPSNSIDSRGTETGTFFSLGDMVDDPLSAISLYFRTLMVNGDFYLTSLIGGSLGWFQANLRAPYFYLFVYCVVMLIAAQKDSSDSNDFPPSLKYVCLVIICLCLFGCMLSMYLGWTFNTESIIQGVQGRYLLPVLLLGLMVVRWRPLAIDLKLDGGISIFLCVLNILYLIGLVATALVATV